jgi:hypothetical protein
MGEGGIVSSIWCCAVPPPVNKRLPAGSIKAHFVSTQKNEVELVTPVAFEFKN